MLSTGLGRLPGEVKRMKMSEATRLLDYWAEECPPPHIALVQIRDVVITGLGGTPPGKSSVPASTMTFDEFIAVAGGGEAVPDGK